MLTRSFRLPPKAVRKEFLGNHLIPLADLPLDVKAKLKDFLYSADRQSEGNPHEVHASHPGRRPSSLASGLDLLFAVLAGLGQKAFASAEVSFMYYFERAEWRVPY
jgi:hypothetical protein